MQIFESRSQVASVRFGLALVVLAALAFGIPGTGEAAQSCRDLPVAQDMETVSSAAEVPGVYVARLNAGDAERVTDLFADDALHRGPDGQIRRGRTAILAFYEGVLANGPGGLAVGQSVADSRRVAFELINVEGCNDEDPATAVDLIEINDANRIRDFTVFFRPDGRWRSSLCTSSPPPASTYQAVSWSSFAVAAGPAAEARLTAGGRAGPTRGGSSSGASSCRRRCWGTPEGEVSNRIPATPPATRTRTGYSPRSAAAPGSG